MKKLYILKNCNINYCYYKYFIFRVKTNISSTIPMIKMINDEKKNNTIFLSIIKVSLKDKKYQRE